jgi:hypothetical protein
MAKKGKKKDFYYTPEPDWEEFLDAKTEEEKEKAFSSVNYFVRTEINDKVKITKTREWIKHKAPWNKKDREIILASPDWVFSSSSITFFIEDKLGYLPEKIAKHIDSRKKEWLKRGQIEIDEKKAKQKETPPKRMISIQDRMKLQIGTLCGDLEYFLDELIDGKKTLKQFKPYEMMMIYQPEVKVPHAKLIKEEFSDGHLEALEVQEWKDPDIKEAYSNFNLKLRKAYVEYYEMINTACDTIIQTKATKRKARKPKARSKEKIVQKLKFKINEPDLGLASVTPTDVVYANECWVYNVKTRKLGVYKALNKDPRSLKREGAGLNVKGTTLKGFCEVSSLQKTLRKPKEQLKPFIAGAKTSCNKNFEAITTTDTRMNGRFNEHTIILKTF